MSKLNEYKLKLISALELNGITIRRDLCGFIIDSLHSARIDLHSNFENCIKIICETLEKHSDANRSIEKVHVSRAIEACIQSGVDKHETKLSVIDAYHFPKLQFNLSRKLYFLDSNSKPIFFSKPETKSKLFQDRYRKILQRTKRNLLNRSEQLNENISLYTVDSLLTVSQMTLEYNLILGCLFQGSYDKYYLEDPTGMVELNLKNAKYRGGFICENSFVLVNGHYSDKILEVDTMMLPPGEEFEKSKNMFGNINYFGGKSEPLLRESKKLAEIMQENEGGMMVFISDLWLDNEMVFQKLETLFTGFSEIPPIAFIFMGNFISSHAAESSEILAKLFKKLAELIHQYDKIVKYSHFVFVPGLEDPCMQHLLPRMPLPKLISSEFQKIIPKSTFTTNPCRIQYCTREITVARINMLSKCMQESFNQPKQDKIDDFVGQTIISQGHLAPLALHVQPVHWSFDYTLSLYPLPNLVVIGDKTNPYSSKHKGCSVINPGSFVESGFSFKTYVPASDTIDDCGL